jgi:hypothetical protein
VHLVQPDLHRPPNLANQLPAWVLWILVPWMVWEGARILRRLMRESWEQIGAPYWPLSLSVALVAVANFGLLTAQWGVVVHLDIALCGWSSSVAGLCQSRVALACLVSGDL